MARGRLITIEGIEGSGKSLQVQLLARELTRRNVPFLATYEPGDTAFGREVRDVLLQTSGAPREPVSELLLYLADRFQHLKEAIEPAIDAGKIVVCDRYHDATLAYQGLARGIGIEVVEQLSAPLKLLTPDLTLVLDLEVGLGLQRAKARNQRKDGEQFGRFEAEDLEFHYKVREGYHELINREPERFVVIDASRPPDEVFDQVVRELDVRNLLNDGNH